MSKIPVDILQLSLNILAMCNELDRNAFCIIDSHLSTCYKLFYICSTSFEQPPMTSMMMLCWLTLYSGYRLVSSSLNWLYLVVFSKFLDSIFQPWTAHFNYSDLLAGLVLSLVLSMIVASILLAFTWVVSANNGTSQKAVACSFSYSGLGVTCENHGSTLVMRSKDLRTSKNKILKALLCLCRYLVCASALQPDRMCCTFSRESPHRRHFSSVTCDFVFLL